MFFFTYLPQLGVLVFVNGPVAPFTTALLVLNESSTIVSIISRNWLLQDALLDTFDGTLVAKGTTNLVSEGRQLKAGGDPIEKLGRILKSPFERFSPKALVRYVMYLPLNFIPGMVPGPRVARRMWYANMDELVVGTVIFILLQGKLGPWSSKVDGVTDDRTRENEGTFHPHSSQCTGSRTF